jgi:hypothetical protein
MPLATFDRSKVDMYFSEIEPFREAYRHRSLRYLAIRGKDGLVLLHGVLELSAFSCPSVRRIFQTADIICSESNDADLGAQPRKLVEALLSGSVELDGTPLLFPPDHSENHHAHNWPFDGGQQDARSAEGQLMLSGANDRFTYVQSPEIFRQLRTSVTPYDGPFELAADFGLRLDHGMQLHFDIYTRRIAELLAESVLDGSDCMLRVRLAAGLDPSKSLLGTSVRRSDGQVVRAVVSPSDFRWEKDEEGHLLGTARISLADAATVDCVLSYGGLVQHRLALGQPLHQLNTLRFAYELFDTEERGLQRVIRDHKITNRDGRELELTLVSLLGMRGLSTLVLDRIPHLQEIPDIVAADARGNLLVIECTLDLPNADNKLSQLYRKAQGIRHALGAKGRGDIQVIAILAASRTATELDGYREEAHRQGILLWGREDLSDLQADRSAPDSIEFYDKVSAMRAQTELLRMAIYPPHGGETDP